MLIGRIADVAASSPGRYGTGKAWFVGGDVRGASVHAWPAGGWLPELPGRSRIADASVVQSRVQWLPSWREDSWPRCNLLYEKVLFFQETKATLHIDMPKSKYILILLWERNRNRSLIWYNCGQSFWSSELLGRRSRRKVYSRKF